MCQEINTIQFYGGGKSKFPPAKRAQVTASLLALHEATGLNVTQTRCEPNSVEFDIVTSTGVAIQSIRYWNDADGLILTSSDEPALAAILEANRAVYKLDEC